MGLDVQKLQAMYDEAVKEFNLLDKAPIPYVIPSGSLLLDRSLGVGGYPAGRIIEIYGPESSGKSTLAIHACINAQRLGKSFAYIDMETTFDESYFHALGGTGEQNVNWLKVCPEVGEDAFEIICRWIDAGVDLLVLDSVAAMIPKAELEGDMGEAFMGLQARMMGQGMRKLVNRIYAKGATVIFINQTRQKIGVVFGSNETTTGGNALKFYASVRLDIRQVGDFIEDKDKQQIGKYSKIVLKKNKVAPPMKSCLVPIIWGRGIAREYELLDLFLTKGIISKSSSYFIYKEEKFNGKIKILEFINNNFDKLLKEIEDKKWMS